MEHKASKRKVREKKIMETGNSLPVIYSNAAGIDIGSRSHFVAVPTDRDKNCVQEFFTFTSDLHRLVAWLTKCGIDTVVMESTGTYWIPVFEMLDEAGFDVKLVNARHVKNVSAHKTDVLDCQWLQQLASFGLLRGAFRPDNAIIELRAYLRHRDNLIKCAAQHIQHMQKALTQMNLLLHNVISDITGKTGMDIIRSIISGERDPKVLASFRDGRCRNSEAVIRESLVGNYRKEHIFALKQALELYDFYTQKIIECDSEILIKARSLESKPKDPEKKILEASAKKLRKLGNSKKPPKLRKHEYPLEMGAELIRICGVDLRRISGINTSNALGLIAEIGTDMSPWRSAKHFCSWLGLCPGNKVSGGKRLSGKTKPCANRAATILRMAANTLYHSDCAIGAFLRRMKMRLGSPKAITAAAHKLAKQVYYALKYGRDYIDVGAEAYEMKYRKRQEANLHHRALQMGFKLVQIEDIA